MPSPDSTLMLNVGNRVINEDLDYYKENLHKLHDHSLTLLNNCQRPTYEEIISSVDNDEGKLIFMHGHGGTSKTFPWKKIISRTRSESKIFSPLLLNV
ncbi:hypothetical protein EJD97_004020 [Solanum chilense]|uniref:ATP-dependent DNA helicase n=1 Tax=Solanum chilense TaxID=4083 RepID=A0A6N2BY42_SOLCI|nr:hypothetical protein EJD97_004020 [Solanum chilense]